MHLRIMENSGSYYPCKSAVVEETFPFFDSLFSRYRSYFNLIWRKISEYLFNKILFPSLWRVYGEIDRGTLDSFGWKKWILPNYLILNSTQSMIIRYILSKD